MMKLVVTGIGTNVGKTVVSAILCEALKLNYWKPVQAGDLDQSDSIKVANWVDVNILPEKYRLQRALSPHTAAFEEKVNITLADFVLPKEDHLLIEGAGGLMVPISNEGFTYIDVFQKWQIPVVLVSMHYLGSINHTLLSIEALKSRNIPIAGLIFVGETHPNNVDYITKFGGVPVLGNIPLTQEVNKAFVANQAQNLLHNLKENGFEPQFK
jgi:dethiobiotin synthetase